jgi:hypothetical protein
MMQDRDRISDEVPVADAVEQAQETADVPPAPGPNSDSPPVEANVSDWQEQHQEVVGDDRDEYRE